MDKKCVNTEAGKSNDGKAGAKRKTDRLDRVLIAVALLSAAVFGSIVGFGIFAYKRRKSKPDESEH